MLIRPKGSTGNIPHRTLRLLKEEYPDGAKISMNALRERIVQYVGSQYMIDRYVITMKALGVIEILEDGSVLIHKLD